MPCGFLTVLHVIKEFKLRNDDGYGRHSQIKGARMLVVLLSGVNFGFWSHLGYSGQNAIICSPYVAVKVSFKVAREEIKIYVYLSYKHQ